MSILYIEHYAGSPEMGMEFRPYYLAKEWIAMGHDVRIVAGDYSHLRIHNPKVDADFQEEVIDGITYNWVKTGNYKDNGVARALTMFRFVHKLRKKAGWIVENWKPDVIIASSTYPLDTYAGQKIKRITKKHGAKGGKGATLIHEVHDMWPITLIEIGGIELTLLQGGTTKVPDGFYYLTCHREENTNDDKDLLEIFKATEMLDAPTIYPVHPRNKQRAVRIFKANNFTKLILTEPVGYLESACLVKNAKKIVTDSGGLQREAFYAGKKCVTILNFVCWPETMIDNRNELSRPVAEEIVEKLSHVQIVDESYLPFGDGHSSDKIVEAIENAQKERKKS